MINLPFKEAYQNYRSNLIHITMAVTLLCANYYRAMKTNTPLIIKGYIFEPVYLQLSLIILCVSASFLITLYEGYLAIRKCIIKRKNDQVVNPSTNNLNEFS